MKQKQTTNEPDSVMSYTFGFALSIVLTFAAYYFVVLRLLNGISLEFVLIVLAGGQAAVQLFFFLHLGREERPRWRLLVFCFMLLIMAVLVGGTLWIMHHLNHNMSWSSNAY